MIKVLKLQKAVYLIVLGILAVVVAQIMSAKEITGDQFVLGLAGVFFIIGSLMFLYPILFAKKVDNGGKKVELQPIAKEPVIEEEGTNS
ncbi:MAG: isoleucyl-tRNA synthetase [Sphingobacteriaceae bacterium]|nr:isoleucyl-tRNA synthetase [Sphingobacteriaceae bacterium]